MLILMSYNRLLLCLIYLRSRAMYRIPLMSTVLSIVEPLEKVYLYEVGQTITRPHIAKYQFE